MEKRYQVFVSSTFSDLVEERRAVMQALLQLDCIPAGMELFPASDDDAWTLIRRVIDDCDYYLVILAGRYGSVDSTGTGFTEKEYDYAIAAGKPVMSVLHSDPDSLPARHTERDPEFQRKLAAFRAKVMEKKHCRFWKTADELGTVITTSLVKLIKTHPAQGWVQAKHVKTTEDAEKVTSLLEQVRTLEKELEALRKLGVADTSGLAQGEEPLQLEIGAEDAEVLVDTTWNKVFAAVGEACLQLPTDDKIAAELTKLCQFHGTGYITRRCVEMIKTQFYCLGLVRIISRVQRPQYRTQPAASHFGDWIPGDVVTLHWELTDYGRVKLGELVGARAVRE